MAYERIFPARDASQSPVCIHLRSKGMYVSGSRDALHADEHDSHVQNCWCNVTQHVVGPDEAHATVNDCIRGRDCFRET